MTSPDFVQNLRAKMKTDHLMDLIEDVTSRSPYVVFVNKAEGSEGQITISLSEADYDLYMIAIQKLDEGIDKNGK